MSAGAPHRFSGYPGAWCLDCGQEDQNEWCVADHNVGLTCIYGHVQCEEEDHPLQQCTEHVNGPCLHPGEGLADPYKHLAQARADLVALLIWRWFDRCAVLDDAMETGAFL